MKKGTLIRNHWASDKNPQRFFIYTGTSGKFVNGLAFNKNGQFEKIQFYKADFNEGGKMETIGYSEGFDVLKNDLKNGNNFRY